MGNNGSATFRAGRAKPYEPDPRDSEPRWDIRRGRWQVTRRISESVFEYVEVPSPETGHFRDPPKEQS